MAEDMIEQMDTESSTDPKVLSDLTMWKTIIGAADLASGIAFLGRQKIAGANWPQKFRSDYIGSYKALADADHTKTFGSEEALQTAVATVLASQGIQATAFETFEAELAAGEA